MDTKDIKLNKDNILPYLARVSISNGEKNGYVYHMLNIHFKNGYKTKPLFLSSDALYIINDTLKTPADDDFLSDALEVD